MIVLNGAVGALNGMLSSKALLKGWSKTSHSGDSIRKRMIHSQQLNSVHLAKSLLTVALWKAHTFTFTPKDPKSTYEPNLRAHEKAKSSENGKSSCWIETKKNGKCRSCIAAVWIMKILVGFMWLSKYHQASCYSICSAMVSRWSSHLKLWGLPKNENCMISVPASGIIPWVHMLMWPQWGVNQPQPAAHPVFSLPKLFKTNHQTISPD